MSPPARRAGPSLSLPSPDDVTALTLPQIRSRLERNERVLQTSLFSSPPSTSTSSLSSSPTDPLREKLLASREQLLQREQELVMAEGLRTMDVSQPHGEGESSEAARRQSYSGKARAMDYIQSGDERSAKNGVMLPLAQTLALGERDSDRATAQSLAAMSLSNPRHSSSPGRPKSRRPGQPPLDPGGSDEISRAQAAARMRAFMSYKGDDEDDPLDDDEWGEGEYDGDEDKLVLDSRGRSGVKKERGTGEEVDEVGEDEEGWEEGNDEYYDRARQGK